MKTVDLYGIVNCDTVKRARAWLATQGVDARFHDFKRAGAGTEELQRWSEAVGWEALLNRRGTTWRKLAPEAQAAVQDGRSALALMHEHSSVIRRPVVEWPDGAVTVGFDAADWSRRLG